MPLDPVVVAITQLATAWLFAHAAWHKLRAPHEFRSTLQRYALLPAAAERPAAFILMGAEVAVALGAAVGRPSALLGGAGLLLLYAAAMAINLIRDRASLDCGCGGPPQPISWYLVARNGLLAGVALTGVFPVGDRALGFVDGLVIGAVLLVLAGLYAGAQAVHAARAQLEEWV